MTLYYNNSLNKNYNMSPNFIMHFAHLLFAVHVSTLLYSTHTYTHYSTYTYERASMTFLWHPTFLKLKSIHLQLDSSPNILQLLLEYKFTPTLSTPSDRATILLQHFQYKL